MKRLHRRLLIDIKRKQQMRLVDAFHTLVKYYVTPAVAAPACRSIVLYLQRRAAVDALRQCSSLYLLLAVLALTVGTVHPASARLIHHIAAAVLTFKNHAGSSPAFLLSFYQKSVKKTLFIFRPASSSPGTSRKDSRSQKQPLPQSILRERPYFPLRRSTPSPP